MHQKSAPAILTSQFDGISSHFSIQAKNSFEHIIKSPLQKANGGIVILNTHVKILERLLVPGINLRTQQSTDKIYPPQKGTRNIIN